MSRENLNLEFTVEGPYTVGKSLAYYGANNASGRDAHPVELVRDVLQLFTADKGAGYPYSDYDNNNDEFVDGIFVIHAGKGEEFGGGPDTIWSHQLSLGAFEEGFVTAPDGITKFNTYTIEPEYNRLPGDATIGVFCHEFGHVLGLPDLYDVNYETAGVGMWSLMSTGSWGSGQARQDGKDPAPFLAWERYFLGGEDWVTLEELGSSAQNVSIDDIEAAPRKAYKIYLNSPGQFLILEGKKKVFDIVTPLPFVPADGILITQIHDGLITSKRLSNTVATGLNRVHGINILEANTPHDEAGRGHLWLTLDPDYTNKYPNTPFSSETRDNLGGSRGIGARGPLFPSGFPSSAWPVCAAAVFFFFLGKARKKCVFPALAVTLALSAFLLTCSLDGSDDDNGAGGGYKLVSYPNSNYYLSEDIYSKTGISGVTLSNISSRASFPMTFDLKLE
jgi:M6 family metalloprotease-like protein